MDQRAHEKYQRLIDFCKALPPTPTAVAHPCDESSLRGAVDAATLVAARLAGDRNAAKLRAHTFPLGRAAQRHQVPERLADARVWLGHAGLQRRACARSLAPSCSIARFNQSPLTWHETPWPK